MRYESLDEALPDLIDSIIKIKNLKNSPVLIAIDGRSGVGKSTLAQLLTDSDLDCAVIKGDEFYVGGSDEYWLNIDAKERYEKVIDYRRQRKEVLEPLRSNQIAKWKTFNWETQEGLSELEITTLPKPLIILEGIYSFRPELSDIFDLSVIITLEDSIRRDRLIRREGSKIENWHKIWDVAEDYYFENVRTENDFDFIIDLQ